MNESNFLPMSEAMQRSDAVPSHRELLQCEVPIRELEACANPTPAPLAAGGIILPYDSRAALLSRSATEL